MSNSGENRNLSTYVYMATFKCHVNCGNLCLTINLDVEKCKLNYQWAQFEDFFGGTYH